jgi:hypothetical protein
MKWNWRLPSKVKNIFSDENQKLRDRISKLTEQRDSARLQRDKARGTTPVAASTSSPTPTSQSSASPSLTGSTGSPPMTRVEKLERTLTNLANSVDLLKSKIEIPSEQWHHLQELRRQATPAANPLVSVCISTHNRVGLLMTRALPSILNQTYRNLEIIVIADGCDDGTAAAVESIGDDRIRLHQIERLTPRLDESERRWMVSGSRPNTVAQELATGDFVTHLDDDDEHLPDRIQLLVDFAIKEQCDVVYHPFLMEAADGSWTMNEALGVRIGQVTTSSIFYRNWIKHIPWDIDTHLLAEPADWNRIRRMVYAGAKFARHTKPLLRHFRERNQASTSPTNAIQSPPQGIAKSTEGLIVPKREAAAGTSASLIHVVGNFDFGLRHDWGHIMGKLEESYGGGPVALVSGIDWLLMSGEPFPEAWIGVFHQPFASHPPCTGLFELKAHLEKVGALKGCKGIYVLTDFQKRFLEDANLGVPIEMLWHPTVFDVEPWSPNKWLADQRIVFLGRWIRRVQSIQDLECPGVRKLWLAKQSEAVPGVVENGTVERLGFVDAAAYDNLLTGCVAMTDVIEAAANNVVLECIARSTPLLVNWNTGVVEYLGAGYPLYYSSIAEANWKASNVRLIMEAHEYLSKMDKSHLTLDRFVKDFANSQILRNLQNNSL